MTSKKITIDISVMYIPKSEHTRESKPKLIKADSPPRKQNKNIPQKSKKVLENVAASGFAYLK